MNGKIWKAAASNYRKRLALAHGAMKTSKILHMSAEAKAGRLVVEVESLTRGLTNLRWTLDAVKSERDAAFIREEKLRDELVGANNLIDSLDEALASARRERDDYFEQLERLRQDRES